MTLATQIVSDRSIFLDTDDFAQSVTHYPAGDLSGGVTVTAVVTKDDLASPSGNVGAGYDLSDEKGVRIRQTAILYVSSAVTVTEKRGKLNPSIWLIDGVKWVTIRVDSTDSAMQSVTIARVDKKLTRRTQAVQ